MQFWLLLGKRKPKREELPCDELVLAPSISSMSWNMGDSHVMNLLWLPMMSKGAGMSDLPVQ